MVPLRGSTAEANAMTVTIDITEAQIMAALRTFLIGVLPDGVEVVRGQDNRVGEPPSADFIVMTPVTRTRVSTNFDTWSNLVDLDNMTSQRGTFVDIQLDIHGDNGADYAQIITTVWRDEWAVSSIEGAIFAPLYASDGHQLPFINGEKQYEDRWIVDLFLHVKPTVTFDQDFATSANVSLVAIDAKLG